MRISVSFSIAHPVYSAIIVILITIRVYLNRKLKQKQNQISIFGRSFHLFVQPEKISKIFFNQNKQFTESQPKKILKMICMSPPTPLKSKQDFPLSPPLSQTCRSQFDFNITDKFSIGLNLFYSSQLVAFYSCNISTLKPAIFLSRFSFI